MTLKLLGMLRGASCDCVAGVHMHTHDTEGGLCHRAQSTSSV